MVSSITDYHVCRECNKKFKSWKREVQCGVCDEGIEEIDNYFGSFQPVYKTCRTCKGEEFYDITECKFCSEECLDEYFEKQTNY
jgi:DnaJ-class molecular chaperone